jgi:FHS family Na+ dependent glucose MFS transporter 1
LLSSFWAAFTFGRLLAIAAAAYVRPQTLLTLDLVGGFASVVFLVLTDDPIATWIGTLALGLSLASLFPASMSFAGEHLHLRGAVTSKLFVGASLGSMLVPWALGYTLVLGPRGPLWIVLIDVLLASGVWLAIYRATARDNHLPPAI